MPKNTHCNDGYTVILLLLFFFCPSLHSRIRARSTFEVSQQCYTIDNATRQKRKQQMNISNFSISQQKKKNCPSLVAVWSCEDCINFKSFQRTATLIQVDKMFSLLNHSCLFCYLKKRSNNTFHLASGPRIELAKCFGLT